MIIIKTISTEVSIPRNQIWAIYTRNEVYLDEDGNIAPDISSGFGPYEDLCIATETIEFVFEEVYAGYEVADRIIQFVNERIYQTNIPIVVNLETLCEDGPGYYQRGFFRISRRNN